MDPLPDLEIPATPAPVEFDVTGWPTWDEIAADERARTELAHREVIEEELRAVLAAVELAAAPVTGALPIIVPLTKADAHEGAVEAVLIHVCDRLREISRSRRTSELRDVIATLEAVI